MPQVDINLLAVFVTGIVGMVIGALWYSPLLFGSAWMKLSGLTKKDLEKAKKKGMAKSYLLGFIAVLVMSYVLAYFIDYTESTTIAQGATAGIWIWVGFIATVLINTVLWEGKPVKLYLINTVHYLVALIVMGAILAVWV